MPERGLDWFFVATEACGGETSDLGLPRGFLEYLAVYRVKRLCGRSPRGHNPLATPGPPGAPRWVVPPSGHPSGTSLAHWMSSGPKKSPKSFAAFGLRLVLIFCDVKNKQKTATGTGHYVNRLVPKNDIKLL